MQQGQSRLWWCLQLALVAQAVGQHQAGLAACLEAWTCLRRPSVAWQAVVLVALLLLLVVTSLLLALQSRAGSQAPSEVLMLDEELGLPACMHACNLIGALARQVLPLGIGHGS